MISDFDLLRSALLHVGRSDLCCLCKTDDTGYVLGTCSSVALLCSAVDKGFDLYTFSDI